MTRVIYVNGRYLPYRDAGVHAEDRGFQFADAVYEVVEIQRGRLVDETRHVERLARSLGEIGMPPPMSPRALGLVMREVIRRNRVRNGLVYLQVTRGAAPRDFQLPGPEVVQTVVCLARRLDPLKLAAKAEAGIAVKTMPEMRWARGDIKTVMLLPACLAKEAARLEGAQEAWFIGKDGYITEGASSNAWIIDRSGKLITRGTGTEILPGITRRTLMDLLGQMQLGYEERPFTRQEALGAAEAFITSASGTVMPVVRIDGTPIGGGTPGPMTRSLRANFHQVAEISD